MIVAHATEQQSINILAVPVADQQKIDLFFTLEVH